MELLKDSYIEANRDQGGTTLVDVPGLQVVYTVPVASRPLLLMFTCVSLINTTNANGGAAVAILQDGTEIFRLSSFMDAANEGGSMSRWDILNPTPGVHTWKAQSAALIAGTSRIGAGVQGPGSGSNTGGRAHLSLFAV